MLESVLVANRGEIARRVMRTARRMGIRTVAVYSDADAELPYVREADEAVHIGPAQPARSYLDGAAIIDAARKTRSGRGPSRLRFPRRERRLRPSGDGGRLDLGRP